MNREEKILSNEIYNCDVRIESNKRLLKREDGKYMHEDFKKQIEEQEYLKSIYQRELQLLQLPQRTIDTLQKGDLFKGECISGHATITLKGIITCIDNKTHQAEIDGTVYEIIKVFPETLPYEAIKLLEELQAGGELEHRVHKDS